MLRAKKQKEAKQKDAPKQKESPSSSGSSSGGDADLDKVAKEVQADAVSAVSSFFRRAKLL